MAATAITRIPLESTSKGEVIGSSRVLAPELPKGRPRNRNTYPRGLREGTWLVPDFVESTKRHVLHTQSIGSRDRHTSSREMAALRIIGVARSDL